MVSPFIPDVVGHHCCVWPSGQPCRHSRPHSSSMYYDLVRRNGNLMVVQDEFQQKLNSMRLDAGRNQQFQKNVRLFCYNGVCNYHERSCQNGVCNSQGGDTINGLTPNSGEIGPRNGQSNLDGHQPSVSNPRVNEPSSHNTGSERENFVVQAIQII